MSYLLLTKSKNISFKEAIFPSYHAISSELHVLAIRLAGEDNHMLSFQHLPLEEIEPSSYATPFLIVEGIKAFGLAAARNMHSLQKHMLSALVAVGALFPWFVGVL